MSFTKLLSFKYFKKAKKRMIPSLNVIEVFPMYHNTSKKLQGADK